MLPARKASVYAALRATVNFVFLSTIKIKTSENFFSFFEKKLLTRNQVREIVIPDRSHHGRDKNQRQKMNTQAATKISEMFSTMTTAQLVEAFNATEGNNAQEIPTVRGWIMDELEKRNPTAFMAWIDGDAFKGPEFYF